MYVYIIKTKFQTRKHELSFFLAEDIDADGLLLLYSTKLITVSELDGLFSLCSSTCNSYVSLDFCLEKKASIFLVFFTSENLSF